MIVKDPGKVQGDLSEYMNNMDNCNSKFDGLGSYWKGPSREKLLASVNSFLGEAKVVNTQMTKLASASTAYVDYLELKKICEQLDAKIAAEEAKIDSDGNFYGDQGQINAWKEEIKQHVESISHYDIVNQSHKFSICINSLCGQFINNNINSYIWLILS